MYHWEVAPAVSGRKLVVTTVGYGDAGGGVGGGRGMCTKEAEYGRAVNFNAPNSDSLQGNSADSRDVGREKVVGEGGTGPGGSMVSDGGIRRGGSGGRDGGRSRGISGKVNHGIN